MRTNSGFEKAQTTNVEGAPEEPAVRTSYAAVLGAQPRIDRDRTDDSNDAPFPNWVLPAEQPADEKSPDVVAKEEEEAAWDGYLVARLGVWVAAAARSEAYTAFLGRERAPLAAIADEPYRLALNGLMTARRELGLAEARHAEAIQARLSLEPQQAHESAAAGPAQ
ncbi:MAG TPA: hypothetical protein VD735_02755 [Candidatus Saccharimonadales bacterium]|nr:hypothetical protein [Candidatus Saccharimonadales bacterium]